MTVLKRMAERGVTTKYLTNEIELSKYAVLQFCFHTPKTLAQLAELLGWPPDHFEGLELPRTARPRR
jgi:hypothetical protein